MHGSWDCCYWVTNTGTSQVDGHCVYIQTGCIYKIAATQKGQKGENEIRKELLYCLRHDHDSIPLGSCTVCRAVDNGQVYDKCLTQELHISAAWTTDGRARGVFTPV